MIFFISSKAIRIQDGWRTQRITKENTHEHITWTPSGLLFEDFYIPHSFQTYNRKQFIFIPRLIEEKKKDVERVYIINVTFCKIAF